MFGNKSSPQANDSKFLVGRQAPNFQIESNRGIIKLGDFEGRWIVLFSHAADFSPSWASEIDRFSRAFEQLRNLNCQLLGIVFENDHSPLLWPRAVQEQFETKIWFPVIFDPHFELAERLGMVNQDNDAVGPDRSIFIIDDKHIIRSVIYYDPVNPDTLNGLIRLIKLLQRSNACGIVTPDNWRPGNEWILLPPENDGEQKNDEKEMWYF